MFYFGSAIGETGNVPTNAIVNAADEIGVRNNPAFFPPATLTDAHDFNRDKTVGAADQIITRNNTTFFDALKLIAVPSSSPEAEAAAVPEIMGTGSGAEQSAAQVPVPIISAHSSPSDSVGDGKRGQAPSSFDTLRTTEPVPFFLESQPVTADSTAERLHRAATAEDDLATIGDETADPGLYALDDALVDLLAESSGLALSY